MKHSTACKFCNKTLLIEIDDSYSIEHDPLKILCYAACNRCADLRVRRRKLEDSIESVAMTIVQAPARAIESASNKARPMLTKLTQSYARMVAEWVRSGQMAWDEEVVNMIIEKPHKWSTILQQLWKLYNPNDRTMKEQELA